MERTEKGYYQWLYEAAAVLNSAHTPDAVLQSLVETVTRAMQVKGCSLMLLSPDSRLLIHTVAHGLSDWYVRKGPLSADRSISEALEGKPVAIADATKDERVQYREQAKKEGIVSILCVPIMLRNKVIGVLRVYTAEPHQFTDDDVYFTSAIANLGAIALDNAHMCESLKKAQEVCLRELAYWQP